MKLYWTLEAIADRDAIFDYIEADNPAAALALDELFSEGVFSITSTIYRFFEPVFHLQAIDLGKMSLIVSHQRRIDHQDMGSNHRISETNGFTFFTRLSSSAKRSGRSARKSSRTGSLSSFNVSQDLRTGSRISFCPTFCTVNSVTPSKAKSFGIRTACLGEGDFTANTRTWGYPPVQFPRVKLRRYHPATTQDWFQHEISPHIYHALQPGVIETGHTLDEDRRSTRHLFLCSYCLLSLGVSWRALMNRT